MSSASLPCPAAFSFFHKQLCVKTETSTEPSGYISSKHLLRAYYSMSQVLRISQIRYAGLKRDIFQNGKRPVNIKILKMLRDVTIAIVEVCAECNGKHFHRNVGQLNAISAVLTGGFIRGGRRAVDQGNTTYKA